MFKDFVNEFEFDIIAVTETWIGETAPSNLFHIDNYNLVSKERSNKRGGGVALYVRNSIQFKILDTSFVPENNVEHLWILCMIYNIKICIGVIYNPNAIFYKDLMVLESIFTEFNSQSDYLVCTGDININLLVDDARSNYFKSLLSANSMHQIINKYTRPASQSLIDVMLLSDENICLDSDTIDCSDFSDHDSVYCILNILKPNVTKKTYSFRDFKLFNVEHFLLDCEAVNWNNVVYLTNVNDKVEFINQNIVTLFDKHAPVKKICTSRKYTPWITPVIKIMQRKRDKALLHYKKYKTVFKFEYYKQLRNLTTAAVRREKQAFFNFNINSNISDSGKLWNNLKRLGVNKIKQNIIGDSLCKPQEYGQHLIDKLDLVNINPNTVNYYHNNNFSGVTGEKFYFKCVDSDIVEKIIRSLKSDAIGVDGISRKMILIILPVILDYITHIVNTCLLDGVVPDLWKSAIVKPIAKHTNSSTFDDLRPISILPALSKVMERICCDQIMSFAVENDILPSCQSGFRAGFSTNTCLLNIVDTLIGNYDNSKISFLIQIDFSKAFDMIHHGLLLAKLKYYNFSNNAIKWCKNYLENRNFFVSMWRNSQIINSAQFSLNTGVPQGSILGPLLFIIYIADLGKDLTFCDAHSYADDTQILASTTLADLNKNYQLINSDLEKLATWVRNNGLKINSTKSSLLVLGAQNINIPAIILDGVILERNQVCKSLGMYIDDSLNFRVHLQNKLKAAMIKLRHLYQFRNILSSQVKLRLVSSLVLSIFDYCACVYIPNLTQHDKHRITTFQNSCLRYVYGVCKFDHISAYRSLANMEDVSIRAKKFLLTLTHKIKISGTPPYLCNKLTFKNYNYGLRGKDLYSVPSFTKSKFKCSFTYLAPTLYNKLSDEVKSLTLSSFKNHVKKLSDL